MIVAYKCPVCGKVEWGQPFYEAPGTGGFCYHGQAAIVMKRISEHEALANTGGR